MRREVPVVEIEGADESGILYPHDEAMCRVVVKFEFPARLHQKASDEACRWAMAVNDRRDVPEDPADMNPATWVAIVAEHKEKVAEVSALSDRLYSEDCEAYLRQRIPLEYRKPIDRLQMKAPAAFDKVQCWEPWADSKPGLVAIGASGKGKTRAVYARLAELHRTEGTSFHAFTADALKATVLSLSCGEPAGGFVNMDAMMAALTSVDVLFLDDLSQAKVTAVYAEKLFAMVERRTARGLAMAVTVQMQKGALVAKLAGRDEEWKDTAECIARRLSDYCMPVSFD